MNKIALVCSICLLVSTFSFAQSSDNALGIRTGDNDGFGVEVSYQRALSGNNRLEVGLGLRSGTDYDGFKLTGIYQWLWAIDDNFNWYAGAGGGLGFYDYDNVPAGAKDSDAFLFIAGNLGIEYDFDFPLLISLDVRPDLSFGDINDDLDFDIGLGLRYQF